MAAKKKSTIARQFAALYVNGPLTLRGDWLACEREVKQSVDALDSDVREAIVAEGGQLPDQALDAKLADSMPEPKNQGTGTTTSLDLSAFDMSKPKSNADWLKMAQDLGPVMNGIMLGDIKASAAQTALIKMIMDRAYGKISSVVEEKQVAAGIIILPALGERSEQMVCPNCSFTVEQKFPKRGA
jgi:hypothetical protein